MKKIIINMEKYNTIIIKKVIKVAKYIFFPLAFLFLVYAAWSSKEVLGQILVKGEFIFFILAGVFWALSHLVAPLCTCLILKTYNVDVNYRFALHSNIKNLPARYLPGGVWHTVGRAVDFNAYGIEGRNLFMMLFLENALAVGVSFVLGGVGVWYFRGADEQWGYYALLASGVSIAGLLTLPYLMSSWLLETGKQINWKFYFVTLAVYVMALVILATSFVAYLSAFPLVTEGLSAVEIGVNYLFSWGVGYIAVFAPQGLGVFEVVAGHLLNTDLPLASVAVIIAGFRGIMIIIDVLAWLLLRLFRSLNHGQ